jgi:IS1 family transposase
MNRLSMERRAQVVAALIEGNSIRATVRMTGVAKNTVTKLLVDLGGACDQYMDRTLVGLTCERLQLDEIWSFCHSKEKNVAPEHEDIFGYGDVWTWIAIDADTKLVPSFFIGERTDADALAFARDLKSRIVNRPQITTDALGAYARIIPMVFRGEVDFAQQRKEYQRDPDHKYSPAIYRTVETKIINGDPSPEHISTSFVERQNLTMRMGMRRFTRLTNGFSKKVENLIAAISVHYMHYNFARPHMTLTKRYGQPTTPAMAAGVSNDVWTLTEVCGLMETGPSVATVGDAA